MAALGHDPQAADPLTRFLRDAEVGRPILARSPEGQPAFWFVPLQSGAKACGFARVALDGRVVQLGGFGAGAADTASWPASAFFREPPARVLREVRARHPGSPLSAPVFSYDGSPARWAWCVVVGTPAVSIVYITPGGWHERAPGTAAALGREG